ncbi:zinc finger protein 333-like [Colias croceus]|uniref:zinc finger protein 333-like n=1 Tax=Colias crocea TaxID=72248 RepID=UPI001E27E630|nr:zinc finger protein 333-like [Colias croceus]
MERRSRVLTRRGLRRGCVSDTFSLEDLAEAVLDSTHDNVYVELDGVGQMTCRGGAPRAARGAALAAAGPAAGLLLEPAPTAPSRLRLRLLADAPPHADLTLWFHETTLALLDMPFLTLRNITGKKNYVCHECGAEFEQPNPLKVHLFLKCQQFDHRTFWSKCIGILQAHEARAALGWARVSAAPVTSPAELEALAAAWGRSRDGHVCLYCGKLYSRKYGLKIHIRTHTGYKPLRCRHCLRAFGDPSNLNKHVRLHAAAPARAPHACALCGKALARRRDLQRHLRAHHATDPSRTQSPAQ